MSPTRYPLWLVGLLTLALGQVLRAEPPAKEKTPGVESVTPARTDRYGDPLPRHALTRMGTVRFRHAGPVNFVYFSPDGKTLASSANGIIHLWEVGTGKELHQLKEELSLDVAFAPNGKTLATLPNGSHKIRIWDVASGKELHQSPVIALGITSGAFAPDGKTVAVLCNNQSVQLYEVATGKPLRQLFAPRQQNQGNQNFAIMGLAFSPDGKLLALGWNNNMQSGVRLLDVATGKDVRQLKGMQNGITFFFSPNGKMLAVKDGGQTTTLWEVFTWKELRKWGGRPQSGAETFSPDSKALTWVNGDKLYLEDAATGNLIREFQANHHGISAAAFSPDGKLLATGGANQMIRLWDVATGKELHPFGGHQSGISSVVYSPDGKTVASAGMDQTVRLWEAATGKELHQFLPPPRKENPNQPQGGNPLIVFSRDGKSLAAAWHDGTICLWEVATGKALRAFQEPSAGLTALAFSPDGTVLASAGIDGLLRLREVATGKKLRQFRGSNSQGTNGNALAAAVVALWPDAKTLVTAGYDNPPFMQNGGTIFLDLAGSSTINSTVHFWEVATGRERRQIQFQTNAPGSWGNLGGALGGTFVLQGGGSGVSSLVFSPNGRALAVGSGDTIHLWDAAKGREIRRFGGQQGISNSVTFSPDGKLLATGSHTGAISIWEAATGTELAHFGGHRGPATAVAFSADGKTLVSGGTDTTALVWDVFALIEDERRQAVDPSPQKVEALWNDLAGDDAAKAYQAIWALAAAPKQAVPLFAERLQPAPAVDGQHIARLVADLDGKSFTVRRQATQELEKLGELAQAALEKTLEGQPSLEVRRRVEKLVEKLHGPETSPERLRALRTIEVLENIGNPQARQVLAELAKGAPKAKLTQDAQAALERLAKRASE